MPSPKPETVFTFTPRIPFIIEDRDSGSLTMREVYGDGVLSDGREFSICQSLGGLTMFISAGDGPTYELDLRPLLKLAVETAAELSK